MTARRQVVAGEGTASADGAVEAGGPGQARGQVAVLGVGGGAGEGDGLARVKAGAAGGGADGRTRRDVSRLKITFEASQVRGQTMVGTGGKIQYGFFLPFEMGGSGVDGRASGQ